MVLTTKPLTTTGLLCCTLLLLLLGACSSVPPAPPSADAGDEQLWRKHARQLSQINHWHISGKIAVRNTSNSGSGNLDWQQQQRHFDIRISGPLGQGAMQLRGTSSQLELLTAKQQLTSSQPQLLMKQQLGWSVPIDHLLWWVRGLPASTDSYQLQLDDNSRAWRLEQAGWQLEYLSYQQNGQGFAVPQRIRATGPDNLQLIIFIKDWQ